MCQQLRKTPFTLGHVFCTATANQILGLPNIHRLIEKQLSYDWGSLCQDDWALNDYAAEHGGRVLGYHCIAGEHVYVITEADRSSTTIMLEYEY